MFYDIDNPNKFCKDIYKLLDNDGIWALEISISLLYLKILHMIRFVMNMLLIIHLQHLIT